jgi:hypothetical protein
MTTHLLAAVVLAGALVLITLARVYLPRGVHALEVLEVLALGASSATCDASPARVCRRGRPAGVSWRECARASSSRFGRYGERCRHRCQRSRQAGRQAGRQDRTDVREVGRTRVRSNRCSRTGLDRTDSPHRPTRPRTAHRSTFVHTPTRENR